MSTKNVFLKIHLLSVSLALIFSASSCSSIPALFWCCKTARIPVISFKQSRYYSLKHKGVLEKLRIRLKHTLIKWGLFSFQFPSKKFSHWIYFHFFLLNMRESTQVSCFEISFEVIPLVILLIHQDIRFCVATFFRWAFDRFFTNSLYLCKDRNLSDCW